MIQQFLLSLRGDVISDDGEAAAEEINNVIGLWGRWLRNNYYKSPLLVTVIIGTLIVLNPYYYTTTKAIIKRVLETNGANSYHII